MPTISCEPNDLMQNAACFQSCIPAGMHDAIQTYLLAVIAGGTLDPNELLDNARCFRCIPPGALKEIQAYLLCNIVNSQ